MRVLSVMPGSPEGHNMVFARETGHALRACGVQVEEIFMQSCKSPFAVWRNWLRIRKLAKSRRYDLLHAQYGSVNGFISSFASGSLPVALSVRGSDLNRVPSMNRLRSVFTRLLTQFAALRADAVICVSKALGDQLWCDRRKIVILPSGIDLEVFRPVGRTEARRHLAWPENEPVLLFNAGKAPIQKGQPLVEEAVELLHTHSISVRLHSTNGSCSREEMVYLLSAADCLVLASESEGSPNIVKEAMACNLPVVSVDVGDAVERLRSVQPGAIVAREPDSLARGICEVLSKLQRSNGREILKRQGLSRDEIVAQLELVYAFLTRRSL